MKKISWVIGLTLLFSFWGQTFAGFDDGLVSVKSEIQRCKIASQKQTEKLDTFNCLIRIPEILEGFCNQDAPVNLIQTSQYLSEFTIHFLANKLNKQQSQNTHEEDNSQDITMKQQFNCSICTDEIGGDETHALLGCSHSCHLECIRPSLRSYMEQEKPEFLIRCQEDGCDYKIKPSELASLVEDSDQALAIQRLFVRSVDVLKFCPSCGEGIAKHNGMLGFGYHCQKCDKDICFSCGRPPHHDISCEDIGTNEGVKKAFIAEILKTGQSESFGLCPNCKALIGKLDGCNSMICGKNAEDKKQIPGTIEGRGCGHKFDWTQRIRLENASSIGQSSPSGSGSAHAQPQRAAAQDITQVAAQITPPGLTLEEQRNRAGIIRIEANDERIRDFPEFAALGDMYQVGNLLLSGVAPQRMNYAEANRFCRSLDRGVWNWLGWQGASAPTNDEWRAIGLAMGRGTPAGYNSNLIPNMDDRYIYFWSSSPQDNDFAGVFFSISGFVFDHFGGSYESVRCVRQSNF
ncbi:MAG: IBR domain-containing protein [Bdellovibrionia bacterium]